MKKRNRDSRWSALQCACIGLLLAASALADETKSGPGTAPPNLQSVALPPEALQASLLSGSRPASQGNVLDRLVKTLLLGDDWKQLARRQLLAVDGDAVLLEVRLHPGANRATSTRLAERTGLRVRAQNVPTLFDAWVPVHAIKA